MVLVSAMHITAGVYVNDWESGLIEDIQDWLEKLAPAGLDYRHHQTGEDNADAHLKRTLIGHQVMLPITAGALDLGPWEQVFYAEFDGQRRKRVVVKVMGSRRAARSVRSRARVVRRVQPRRARRHRRASTRRRRSWTGQRRSCRGATAFASVWHEHFRVGPGASRGHPAPGPHDRADRERIDPAEWAEREMRDGQRSRDAAATRFRRRRRPHPHAARGRARVGRRRSPGRCRAASLTSRQYPERPIVGVGAVIVHKGSVVLIKRQFEPLAGQWSLPGGTLDIGESLTAGVAREDARRDGTAT